MGRDLLIGALYGITAAGVGLYFGLIPGLSQVDAYGPSVDLWTYEPLTGLRQALTALPAVHAQATLSAFFGITMFFVLRFLVRRTWIAIGLLSLLAGVLFNPGHGTPLVYVLTFSGTIALFWTVMIRFGLLAVIVGATVSDLLTKMPLTPELASWRGAPTLLTLAVMVAIGGWGFWASLAGRPLFRDDLQESS